MCYYSLETCIITTGVEIKKKWKNLFRVKNIILTGTDTVDVDKKRNETNIIPILQVKYDRYGFFVSRFFEILTRNHAYITYIENKKHFRRRETLF